jgi:hypothetical protein
VNGEQALQQRRKALEALLIVQTGVHRIPKEFAYHHFGFLLFGHSEPQLRKMILLMSQRESRLLIERKPYSLSTM